MAFVEYSGNVISEGAAPSSTVPANETIKFGEKTDKFVKEEEDRLAKEKATKEAATFGLPEWMVVPLATAVGGAIGVAGTLAAKKALKKPDIPERIDPVLNATPVPTAIDTAPTVPSPTNLTPADAAARASTLKPLLPQPPAPVPPPAPSQPVNKAVEMLGTDAPIGMAASNSPIAGSVPAQGAPPAGGIERSVPPVTEPFQGKSNVPPGTYGSPAAPMTAMPSPEELALKVTATSAAPTVAPDFTNVAAAPAPASNVKTAVAPPKTRERLTYPDTPDTWKTLTDKGITFLPGYGGGDNSLFNTYGAEGRKTVLERFNNGKPIGSDENYKKLLVKMRQGVPSSEVPSLMAKLPAAEEAGTYGKLGKKVLTVGGIAGLGLAASELANAATSAKKGKFSKAAGQTAEVGSSFLPAWAQALLYSKSVGAGEDEQLSFQRRMEEANKKGAGNRGAAYDPRKFYTPMDTGNPMFNIGVPPPR